MDLKFACSGEMGQAALVWSEIFKNAKASQSVSASMKNVSSAPVLSTVQHNINNMVTPQASIAATSNVDSGGNQSELSTGDTVDVIEDVENADQFSESVQVVIGSSKSELSDSVQSEDFVSFDGHSKSSKRTSSKIVKDQRGLISSNTSSVILGREDADLMVKNKPPTLHGLDVSNQTNMQIPHGNSVSSVSENVASQSVNQQQQQSHPYKNSAKDNRSFSKTPWIEEGKTYSATVAGLHEEIHDFFNWICPTEAECSMRNEVVKRVQSAVNKVIPTALVEVYGSFKSGLYLPTSDIDLSIMVGNISSVEVAKWLGLLEKQLKADNVCNENGAKVLPHAVVPIIKLTDRMTNVRVDISLNIMNAANSAKLVSEFIRKYPPLPHLVLVLKQFLWQRELNEVYQGGLSSYSLILMVVSFLQLHPRAEGCKGADVNYGVLLIEFFELYGKNMNYLRAGIRVVNGGSYVPRKERQDAPFLSIEDPLDKENDIGKVSWAAQIVKDAFEFAFYVLSRAVTTLTGTQVHSFLSKIININEETQNYRTWVNETWKGYKNNEDSLAVFTPYFTNYANNYNPYLVHPLTHTVLPPSLAGGNPAMATALTSSPATMMSFSRFPLPLMHPQTAIHNPAAALNVPHPRDLSNSANGSSIAGGPISSNNSSCSANSTASESENSGNGAEQSSSYSCGSNDNNSQIPSSVIGPNLSQSQMTNGLVNKRASEYQASNRYRDEKRQAMHVNNMHGAPNMAATYQQPISRYLTSQGNFSMDANKQHPQTRDRQNNRRGNWVRRQGGMMPNYQQQQMGNNNHIMHMSNGNGYNQGGNRRNRFCNGNFHNNNNTNHNSSANNSYHNIYNAQNKLGGVVSSAAPSHAMIPSGIFTGNMEGQNSMDNLGQVMSQLPTNQTIRQFMMSQTMMAQQMSRQQVQTSSPPAPSAPLGLCQPLQQQLDHTGNAMNTYTRKPQRSGAGLIKNEMPESISYPNNLTTSASAGQISMLSEPSMVGNTESSAATAYLSLLPPPVNNTDVGANGDFPAHIESSYHRLDNTLSSQTPITADHTIAEMPNTPVSADTPLRLSEGASTQNVDFTLSQSEEDSVDLSLVQNINSVASSSSHLKCNTTPSDTASHPSRSMPSSASGSSNIAISSDSHPGSDLVAHKGQYSSVDTQSVANQVELPTSSKSQVGQTMKGCKGANSTKPSGPCP